MKMNNHSNNQHQTFDNLSEGLEVGDLARLVDPRVTVDEYKSKIGKDENVLVLTLKVQGKDPALDLVNFIEKSYDWILDADASSGELNDGNYLVFVEADREPELAENIVEMFTDLEKLTGVLVDDWILSNYKPHKTCKVDQQEIAKTLPLTPEEYLSNQRSSNQEIDQLKTAAGVRVETRAPKNDFTESLRIAAGIR